MDSQANELLKQSRTGSLFSMWASLLERLFPDPFTLSLLLSLATIVFAKIWTPHGFTELVTFWGSGLWDFLRFAMQMALVLVAGQALAESPPVSRLLNKLAGVPKSMSQGVLVVSSFAMLGAWFNWGFGLVVGALLARRVSDSLARLLGEDRVSRPLLGAAGYTGLAFWHAGLSGSAPLAVAQADHLLADKIGALPLASTVFSSQNLVLSALLLVLVPLFLVGLNLVGFVVYGEEVESELELTRFARPKWYELTLVLSVSLLALFWWIHVRPGLGLNIIIFFFLFLGLAAHGSPRSYAAAIDRAVRGISGIVLQFPFYAGIAGVAAKSGLVVLISGQFVSLSQGVESALGFQPFLVFVFLSAGLANLFIPSGGGQWVIQGPVVIEASEKLGLDPGTAIMAIAYGDQWTNLLQPFWALPVLAITGLKPAQLLSVTTLLLIWMGLLVALALLFLF